MERGGPLDEHLHKIKRRRISPMQVFPHNEERPLLRFFSQPRNQGFLRLLSLLLRTQLERSVAFGQRQGQ